METKLESISQLSKENPNMVLTFMDHLINKDMLKSFLESMNKDKAVGLNVLQKAIELSEGSQNRKPLTFWDLHTIAHMARAVSSE